MSFFISSNGWQQDNGFRMKINGRDSRKIDFETHTKYALKKETMVNVAGQFSFTTAHLLGNDAPANLPRSQECWILSKMNTIRQVLAFAWPFLNRYRGRLILGLLLGFAYGLFNASFVWGTKTLFERMEPKPVEAIVVVPDKSTPPSDSDNHTLSERLAKMDDWIMERLDPWLPRVGRQLDWTQALGGLLFLPVLVGLRGAISFSSVYCLGWASEHGMRDLRNKVHDRLQGLSMDYFQRTEVGQHTVLVNKGVGALGQSLTYGFAILVKEPFCIIGIMTALFILDWQLALFGVVFAPICLVPIVLLGRKIRQAAQRGFNATSEQDSLLVEVYSNMKTVKSYGLETIQLKRFRDIHQRLTRVGVKRLQAQHQINPVVEVIGMIGLGSVLVYVFWMEKSVPELVAFLTGMIILFQPFKRLGGVNVFFQEAAVGVTMVKGVLEEKPTVIERTDAPHLSPMTESIMFKNVEFAYETQPVLEKLNLEVSRGIKIGVTGESGVGKSTMAGLLLRFMDPTKGKVLIDGIDLRDVSLKSLRGQMALVSQECVIFDQSVAENIACGKTDATLDEIEAAAKSANADGFIKELPKGYDTRLGENGARLSGGQRQRIAIARAFVRQAPILILDEATAALDSKAEAEVQTAIDRLGEGRTVICVAHRLSTLRNMDRIIVLEEGKIVEDGSYEVLLQNNATFAAMASKQGISTEANEDLQ